MQTEEEKPIKLSEFISKIKSSLNTNFPSTYWIIGQVSDFNGANQKGHFYFKLVEKNGQQSVAEIKTIIWNGQSYLLQNYFTQTNIKFQNGLELLVNVKVDYHVLYGLSIIIRSINTDYTLGKIEDAKRITIKKLQDDKVISIIDGKVYSANKRVEKPIVIQRIAVITSKGIEGENDFMTKLSNNKRGYSFSFPFRELLYVSMQGKESSDGIIEKLKFLKTKSESIDVIAIVRGGGDESNFDCFNDYELCKAVANFSIPIFTGIGHEVNQSIIDLVANTSAMVPAEAAEIIIEHNREFENNIDDISKDISNLSKELIKGEKQILMEQENNLKREAKYFISNERQSVNEYTARINNLTPEKVLSRGYAILSTNGKIISSAKGLKHGDKLTTTIKSNTIESEILKIEKRNEK